MRPHDLLRLNAGAKLIGAQAPAWVAEALAIAPFVVVRREEQRGHRIPVGVRGATRAHRHAATVSSDDVAAIISPEALALAAAWRTCARRELPAFAALDPIAAAALELGLVWGPGGSAGFELASGMPVVHEQSDVDVIPCARAQGICVKILRALRMPQTACPCLLILSWKARKAQLRCANGCRRRSGF